LHAVLALLWMLAVPVPHAALYTDPADAAVVVRAQPHGEPVRMLLEYGAALAAFTAVNAGGVAFLGSGNVHVSDTGSVSLAGAKGALTGAGICFALSPLASALASWAVGKTSDEWTSPLGWATLGAYGSSAVAIGAGLGLSKAGISRGAGEAVNTLLYLAVPAGTVLVQNLGKSPLRDEH
jgi:hypothetical protein